MRVPTRLRLAFDIEIDFCWRVNAVVTLLFVAGYIAEDPFFLLAFNLWRAIAFYIGGIGTKLIYLLP